MSLFEGEKVFAKKMIITNVRYDIYSNVSKDDTENKNKSENKNNNKNEKLSKTNQQNNTENNDNKCEIKLLWVQDLAN